MKSNTPNAEGSVSASNEASSPLWSYVERELARRDLTTGDLVRAVRVNRSTLTGWRQGKWGMTISTARSIAALFEVSILEVLVGTGILSAEEAQIKCARPDPAVFTDEELLAEVSRRMPPP